MDDLVLISELNDYIFCPVSIYFHKLYGDRDRMEYQSSDQINGTSAHETIDTKKYSTSSMILQALDVYSEKYRLIGKIDMYDVRKKLLRERKKKVKTIYAGYIYQVYAQYFAMTEMGYEIEAIEIYSMDDNKIYKIPLPYENQAVLREFEKVIQSIRSFDMTQFTQSNREKCKHCIYEPACDRTLLEE